MKMIIKMNKIANFNYFILMDEEHKKSFLNEKSNISKVLTIYAYWESVRGVEIFFLSDWKAKLP